MHLRQIIQNRAVRILIKASPDKRTKEVYEQAKLLPSDSRWMTGNLIMLFKIKNSLTPTYLSSRIQLQNNPYDLRNSSNKIKLSKPKTEFMRRTFLYSSSKIFNSLPPTVRNIQNLKTFIRTLNNTLNNIQ